MDPTPKQNQNQSQKTPDAPPANKQHPQKAAKPYTLVENTSKRMHGVGLPQPMQKNGGDAPTGVSAQDPKVKLIPGINKVDTAEWEKAKTQEMVKLNLKIGTFREHTDCETLSDLELHDALRLIPLCNDRAMLNEWKEHDEREEVQAAIKVQFVAFKQALEGGRGKGDDLM